MSERTCKGGTMTSDGYISHLRVDGLRFLLPVMIDPASPRVDEYHAPLKIDGALAYALPGGKIFQNKA